MSNRRAMYFASTAVASVPPVTSRTSRLKSNSRPSSSRLAVASVARARAVADRLLATRLTARNTNNAIQFWGSAIVKVPTGGRKKKLKQSIAAIDAITAMRNRVVAAVTRTTNRNVSATVVAFDTLSHDV